MNQLAAMIVKIATGGEPRAEPDTRNAADLALSKLGASGISPVRSGRVERFRLLTASCIHPFSRLCPRRHTLDRYLLRYLVNHIYTRRTTHGERADAF